MLEKSNVKRAAAKAQQKGKSLADKAKQFGRKNMPNAKRKRQRAASGKKAGPAGLSRVRRGGIKAPRVRKETTT